MLNARLDVAASGALVRFLSAGAEASEVAGSADAPSGSDDGKVVASGAQEPLQANGPAGATKRLSVSKAMEASAGMWLNYPMMHSAVALCLRVVTNATH